MLLLYSMNCNAISPKDILLQLYPALIYPRLLYTIPIWGSIYKSYFYKCFILQNKAVEIVTQQNGIPVQTLPIPI